MHPDHVTAFVGLGSNLGDRAGNLLLAVRALIEASFAVQRLSAIYETEPIGIESDTCFLNQVAEIRVKTVSPAQMMARLLRIEYLLGRRERTMKRPRTVDLDLLLFGDTRMQSDFLTLPHPRMHLRKFVLCPLAEIAPDIIHPTFRKTIAQLKSACEDDSRVQRWNPNEGLHVANHAVSVL
jgi:2-amino-4-hydroxy-6-hydroxymethyldihydropteridine diphosphokinase